MKGDFSRDTFDPSKHFSRVLMQQGRVLVDADWNEQTAILLHYLRTLAADLIGPHGGPVANLGFAITPAEVDGQDDLEIGHGRYYVDGILVEVEKRLDDSGPEKPWTYYHQPSYAPSPDRVDEKLPSLPYLVYLDVWERHISWIEDWENSEPGIREVALGGPDTCTRARVVWQARVKPLTNAVIEALDLQDGQGNKVTTVDNFIEPVVNGNWATIVNAWWQSREGRGKLRARAKADPATAGEDPCTVEPDARYRGAENQLYRIEVHRGGLALDGTASNKDTAATFKWSRENGSVVFPVTSATDHVVTVENLAPDGDLRLQVGDWVEFVDDDIALGNGPGSLFLVDALDPLEGRITLKAPDKASGPGMPEYARDERPQDKHALLRRWDQKQGKRDDFSGGAILITESSGDEDKDWLHLEDGVHIQFQPFSGNVMHRYRTGDYWLIPARTATRDVEWPGPVANPRPVPPPGVEHHYAPLAIVSVDNAGNVTATSCRKSF